MNKVWSGFKAVKLALTKHPYHVGLTFLSEFFLVTVEGQPDWDFDFLSEVIINFVFLRLLQPVEFYWSFSTLGLKVAVVSVK